MTQQRKIKTTRTSIPVAAAATPVAPPPRRPGLAAVQSLPPMIWVTLVAAVLCVQSIVLAFTPYTYLLDEVKVTMFFILGPLVMLLALGAILLRQAPWPPRAVGWGLLAYGGVLLLSTALSHYPWIGKFYMIFNWASAGFFMAAFVVSAHRRGSYHFLRFLTLLLLVQTSIGFFMYDMTSSPEHHSGIAYLMRFLYGSRQPANSSLYNLMLTLVRADDQLQSTILNRDFFAGFCCMLTPFAFMIGIYPGPTRRPLLWRIIGLVTAVLGALAVFFCKSKGEWITIALAIVFYLVMLFKIGFIKLRDLARGHLLAWLIGIAVLGGAITWMQSPTLLSQLGSTKSSLESREIIWSGAWQIFTENTHNLIFGGGPGTFRIYFSAHRRPDYYLHGINNVTTLAHNYFLDILSETGLLGMAAFGVFLGALFWLGMRHVLKREHDLYTRLALLTTITGLASIYSSNMTSPSARWVIGATPMWSVMGLLAGLIWQAQHGPFKTGEASAASPAAGDGASGAPAHPASALVRQYGPVALFLLGFFMQGYGWISGTRYFSSNSQYAAGLNYLETASSRFQEGDQDTQTLIAYFQESIKYFENAVQIDPTNTSAYYKVGSAYTSLSQIYARMTEQLMNKGQKQDAVAYSNLSDSYLEKAKDAYEKLMSYDPDYAEIHYNMGIIYQLYADLIRRGMQNNIPGELFTKENADHYEKLALDHLERMGKVSIKPEVALLQGQQYLAMGHVDMARDVFRAASHRPSADENMIMNYYRTATEAKDPAGSADALEMIWQKRPEKDDVLEMLVRLARQNKFDDLEARIIARLQEINPIHPKLYELKIDLAQRRGKPEEVLAMAQDYIRCEGSDLELYLLGAQTAEKLGRRDAAREIYARIVKIDRDGKTPIGQAARQWLAGGAPAPAAPQPKAPAPASAIPAPPNAPAPVAPAKAPAAPATVKTPAPAAPANAPAAPAKPAPATH